MTGIATWAKGHEIAVALRGPDDARSKAVFEVEERLAPARDRYALEQALLGKRIVGYEDLCRRPVVHVDDLRLDALDHAAHRIGIGILVGRGRERQEAGLVWEQRVSR